MRVLVDFRPRVAIIISHSAVHFFNPIEIYFIIDFPIIRKWNDFKLYLGFVATVSPLDQFR